MKGTLAADFTRAFNALVAKEPKAEHSEHTHASTTHAPTPLTKSNTWHHTDNVERLTTIPPPSSYTSSKATGTPIAWDHEITPLAESELVLQAWQHVHPGMKHDELKSTVADKSSRHVLICVQALFKASLAM